jgi:hypothetical protein
MCYKPYLLKYYPHFSFENWDARHLRISLPVLSNFTVVPIHDNDSRGNCGPSQHARERETADTDSMVPEPEGSSPCSQKPVTGPY